MGTSMSALEELRDIKNLLQEINSGGETYVDSAADYINANIISELQNNPNVNIFEKIDKEGGVYTQEEETCMIILDLPEKLVLELSMRAHAKETTLMKYIVQKLKEC
jgi:hypothetical protein